MTTKTYDLAFSMGFSCGGTMALRKARLQFASYPLDWIGAPGVVKSAKMVASGFAGWFERGDLQLVDVRGGSFQNNVYLNRRTGFGFPHDFSRFQTFEEAYPPTAEKYARRVSRFLSALEGTKTALVIYIERPIDRRAPDSDLVEARRILSERYPAVDFDLVYFHRREGAKGFAEEPVADGIVAVECEYAQIDHGEISHAIEWDVHARYLGERFRLAQMPDAAAEAAYAESRRKARRRRFGGRLDELKYRLYRKLERELQEKGLVPRERPLWFY